MATDPAHPADHWLDRLARRYTRRQALKGAAAAAAVTTTFPLLRAAPAVADDPHACRQGCLWTNHQTAAEATTHRCGVGGLAAYCVVLGYGPLLGLAFFAFPASGAADAAVVSKCLDNVYITEKADNAACLQPGCPGFNPREANGPCEGVKSNCCPCDNVVQGYQPCVYDCNDPNHDCCG